MESRTHGIIFVTTEKDGSSLTPPNKANSNPNIIVRIKEYRWIVHAEQDE